MNKTSLFLVYALTAILAATDVRAGEAKPTADEVVPLIVIDEVPLYDAIRNVARQMDLNWILDPCAPGPGPGAGKKGRPYGPDVSIRLEQKTVQYAFDLLLKKYGLTVITNPVTTVARVVPIGHRVKPVSASQLGADTNGILPVVTLEGVTLVRAVEALTKAANLKVAFDPTFTKSEFGRDTAELSIRWTHITARQALAALLDNYDFSMVEDPANASVLILKVPQDPDPHGKPKKKGLLSLF